MGEWPCFAGIVPFFYKPHSKLYTILEANTFLKVQWFAVSSTILHGILRGTMQDNMQDATLIFYNIVKIIDCDSLAHQQCPNFGVIKAKSFHQCEASSRTTAGNDNTTV